MRYICTSDWHLSGNRPLMRTDSDWIETQKRHLDVLFSVAKEYDATVLVAGDVFDVPTVPPVILNMVLGTLLRWPKTYFIAGNHDLPYHTFDKVEQCSFGAIRKMNPIPSQLRAVDFGRDVGSGTSEVAMHHRFSVLSEADKPPMRDSVTAKDWLDAYPEEVKLIVVGDNHTPWVYGNDKKNGRLVVNCGCLIQRTATDAQHKCGFYYVDTDSHSCVFHDLSYLSEGCIDLSYIEKAKEDKMRQASYEGLVTELKGSVGKSYDFPNTLREYTEHNREALGEGVADFLEEVVDYIKEE